MKCKIDRLTFCGNLKGSLEVFYENNEFIERKGFAKYPYRYSIHFLDGSVLQVAEAGANVKTLRYDFNPKHKMYEKVQISVLKLFKDAHLTRCDVAYDFEKDMSRVKWFDRLSRPHNVFYSGSGDVETWYIGGKDSELRIRIYNKAKEQKMKDKVLWRAEIQMRGQTAEDYRLWSRQFKGLPPFNPFKDVSPIDDSLGYPSNGGFDYLDIKDRVMIRYLIDHPSGFSELSPNSRRKYKKMILGLACWTEEFNLREEWYKNGSEVGSELESWYSFTTDFWNNTI